VRDVLVENNVREFTVTEINAHEVERAPAERWGRQKLTDLAPRLKLEMAIGDRNATELAYAIFRAARTRRPEDRRACRTLGVAQH
jgi:nitrogen regulatory protein PII